VAVQALGVGAAGLTVWFEAARADVAVHPARVRRDALRADRARVVALGPVALIRGAGRGARIDALPRRVASRRSGIGGVAAGFGGADCVGRIVLACARAVTLAVRGALRGRQVLADGVGIGLTRGNRGALPRRTRDIATPASAGAHRGTADGVLAVGIQAIAVGATALPVGFQAAGSDRLPGGDGADVSVRAIRGGRGGGAALFAGAARAAEVAAGERRGDLTNAKPVAGSDGAPRGGVEAHRGAAGRVEGIKRAAAHAVAHAGRSAGRRILVPTERVRLARRSRPAGAQGAGSIAG
jgi:hypothetical protein